MPLNQNRQPARVALIIFLCLVLFCLVQLTWWVMFHFQTGQEQKQLQIEALELRADLIASSINHQFQLMAERINLRLTEIDLSSIKANQVFAEILNDPGVIGYSRLIAGDGELILGGQVDSTFYYPSPSGIVFYFDPNLPLISLTEFNGDLEYRATGQHDGTEMIWVWVTPEMIRVAPEHKANLDSEARRTTYMFGAESGFFFLIIMAGAFLIYRTLHRSEELKFRQQNFLHSVTHELKAPLASIRLYVETIMTGTLSENKKDEVYPKMIEDCVRLEGLIDNVLEAGHFSKAGYKLKLAQTDLSGDLNEYLNELELTAKRYHGKINRVISENIIIKSDYQAMRRAITALVDNGFKYSTEERREISVTLTSDTTQATIKISDNGIGLEASEKENIFKRFYRVGDENSRNYKGSGLGLFLVREIVEAHHGQVVVESAGLKQGSVFIITLPLMG